MSTSATFTLRDVHIATEATREMYRVNVVISLVPCSISPSGFSWRVAWSPDAIWWTAPDAKGAQLSGGFFEAPASEREGVTARTLFGLVMNAETDIENWYKAAVAATGISPGDG